MKKISGFFVLILVLAGAVARADVAHTGYTVDYEGTHTGDTVSYSLTHKHLKSGNYTVTLVDENNNTTPVQGVVSRGDLSFRCPQLTPGFYQIESIENQSTHKVTYGHLNDEEGFTVPPPSRHKK